LLKKIKFKVKIEEITCLEIAASWICTGFFAPLFDVSLGLGFEMKGREGEKMRKQDVL
jgi:hypothetical protein